MENRCSPRNEINSTVLIYHKSIGCINAAVENMSTQGMLVDIGRSILPKGVIVELAGPAAWKFYSKMGLPKALTIHSNNGKVGLMLITRR